MKQESLSAAARAARTGMLAGLAAAALCVSGCGGNEAGNGSQEGPDSVGVQDAGDVNGRTPDVTTDQAAPDTVVPASCKNDFDCDDQNPCTQDLCSAGKCTASFLDGNPCDDADPCTSMDACQAGKCVGAASFCDDGLPCTEDSCKDGVCKHKVSDGPACALSVQVLVPERGATVTGNPFVTVQGKVDSPAGPLLSVVVNGNAATPAPDGAFQLTIEAAPGINTIKVEALDSFNRKAGRSQSFLFAQALLPPGSPNAISLVPGSALAHLRSDVWDDDDNADLDDMAAIIYKVVNNLDVAALIPSPLFAEGEGPTLAWCTWQATVSDVDYSLQAVNLNPVTGALDLAATMTGLEAYIQTESSWACPDAVGWVYADYIYIDATLPVKVVNGNLEISVSYVNVDIAGVHVDFKGGAASLFDWLINWFDNTLAQKISEKLETYLPETLIPKLEGVLNSLLDKTQTFHVPGIPGAGSGMDLSLKTEPVAVDFTDSGSDFMVDVGVAAPVTVSHPAPGSLLRGDCMGESPDDFFLPHTQPVEVAVAEDMLNQVLFALWAGGEMTATLPGELLADVTGAFGVTNLALSVDALLPPVYTSCTPGQTGQVQVGDLHVAATFDMNGQPGTLDMYAALSMEAEIEVDADYPLNKLALDVGSVTTMTVDVVSSTGPMEGSEDLIEALLSELVANVLIAEYLNEAVAAYPIPAVDLGQFIPGVAPETYVSFQPMDAKLQDGYLLLSGFPK